MNLTDKLQSLGLLTDFIEACDPEVSNPDMVKWLARRDIKVVEMTVRNARVKLQRQSDSSLTRPRDGRSSELLPRIQFKPRKNMLRGSPSLPSLHNTLIRNSADLPKCAHQSVIRQHNRQRTGGRSIRCLGVIDEETFNEM